MELELKRCRCCGQHTFHRLRTFVDVDPFFARHGLQISVEQSIDIPLYDWGLRGKAKLLPSWLAEKFHRKLDAIRAKHVLQACKVKIPFGLCKNCEFLAPWYEIGYDQLSDYYAFYLQNEYKESREAFQPGFRELGKVMGSIAEADLRRQQHEEFILPFLQDLREYAQDKSLKLLDYGGGEGLIIPRLPWIDGDVLEVESAEQPQGPELASYDVVQCLHVLEHVGSPYDTFQRLLAFCRVGGLLYIEVPIEHPGSLDLSDPKQIICHEHINKLSLNSIKGLVEASAVEVIYLQASTVKFLHLDGMTPIVRCLTRKIPEIVPV